MKKEFDSLKLSAYPQNNLKTNRNWSKITLYYISASASLKSVGRKSSDCAAIFSFLVLGIHNDEMKLIFA